MHFGARISQSHLSAHLAFGFQCPLGFWLLASGFARFFLVFGFWLCSGFLALGFWLLVLLVFFLKLLAFGFSFGFWLFALCFWLLASLWPLAFGYWLLAFVFLALSFFGPWLLAFWLLALASLWLLAFGFGFTWLLALSYGWRTLHPPPAFFLTGSPCYLLCFCFFMSIIVYLGSLYL